jgi:multidrug resistance efflux pump
MTLAVFAVSALALGALELKGCTSTRVQAVAQAAPVEHPAQAQSYVVQVHVRPGDVVKPGDVLVTLSPDVTLQELRVLEAELERIDREAEFERAQLDIDFEKLDRKALQLKAQARRDEAIARAEEERAGQERQAVAEQHEELRGKVEQRLLSAEELGQSQRDLSTLEAERKELGRVRQAEAEKRALLEDGLEGSTLERGELETITSRYFSAERRLLEEQRAQLNLRLNHLTIRALAGGRVDRVMPLGAPVLPETSVVSLVPLRATEVVAWLPPNTSPGRVPLGALAALQHGHERCQGAAKVERVGAQVTLAPPQLPSTLGLGPRTGLPVFLSVPEGCDLGVGQVVEAELALR